MYNSRAAANNKYVMPRLIDEISVEYHDELNPMIWEGDKLRIDVQVALLKSAWAFVEFIGMEGLQIEGVRFTGSNASYNYTDYSDCDVHIIIDFSQTPCAELADNFFTTKKTLWNQMHSRVTVNGYTVELYCEDVTNPVKAAGVYDLLNSRWLAHPQKEEPSFDESAVVAKTEGLADEIEALCDGGELDEIDAMFSRLRDMRRAGLEKAGEFSVENLAFKNLRNLGFIEKLAQARLKAQDDDLSLDTGCKVCEAPEGGLHRCTVQTVNAFAAYYHFQPINNLAQVPVYGSQVEAYLMQHGLKPRPEPEAVGKTVQQFVATHRVGTHYISTDGHAMALIQGQLVDAAQQGPDSRRIVGAIEYRR